MTPGLRGMRADLAGLVPDDLEPDAVEDVWARGVWTHLVEPGDGVAGELVAALGASAALALVSRTAPADADPRLREALARWRPRLHASTIAASFATARRAGLGLVTPGSDAWPERLDGLGPHAPLALWARGAVGALAPAHALAVVGARAATAYGEHVALDLAGGVAERGVTVVSGAAYGIDGAAHRACIAAGGRTVAVLAGGVDRPYPRGHTELLDRIAVDGVVVSETPPGAEPTKWRFLQRNRVIAALGDATVVVEAGWRSGSLNTAGHAATLGRPVGAVPGPVTSAASAGCHRLLREVGAQCITGVDDALELIGWNTPHADDTRSAAVLAALSPRTPRSLGELARRTGIREEELSGVLALLELEGTATRAPAGWKRVAS